MLDALVREAPVAIVVADRQGRIRLATAETERRFGWGPGELQGRPLSDLIPDHDLPRHHARFPEFFRNPRPLSFPPSAGLAALCKDGGELPISLQLTPIEADGERLVLGVLSDAQIVKEATDVARRQERTLLTFLDHSPAVVYLKDTDGNYLLVNRQFLQIFGLAREQVVNQPEEKVHPPEVAEVIRRNDREVIADGNPVRFDETVHHRDGPRDYISVKFPMRDSAGQIWGLGGISTDITERNRAIEEVLALSSRMELILNSIGEGVYGLDTEGNVTFVNPAAARMIGWEVADLLGRNQHEVLHHTRAGGEPFPVEECPIYRTLSDGEPRSIQQDLFWRKDGTSFPVAYESVPIRTGGEIVGAVVTFHDLTQELERRRTQRELSAAREVQSRLYPKSAPSVRGVDLAGAVFPAEEACGDYFDFVPLPDGKLAIAVGDVVGHGLGPALVMVAARAFLRAGLTPGRSPAEVMDWMERQIGPDLGPLFLTLLLGVLDPAARTFDYAAAGHVGYHLPADGPPRRLESTAPIVGLLDVPEIDPGPTIRLAAGDLLLLPTDGLEETMRPDGGQFGADRILETAAANRRRPAEEIVRALNDAAAEHRGHLKQADDVTIVLAKFL